MRDEYKTSERLSVKESKDAEMKLMLITCIFAVMSIIHVFGELI